MARRFRAWFFTINNYNDDDMEDVEILKDKNPEYLIIGKELAPTTGTPHLQGYVRFRHVRRLKEMAIVLRRANLRPARGSDQHNKVYCSKDSDILCEVGTPANNQGRRTDLEVARGVVKASPASPMRTLLETTNCNFQCVRLAEKYLVYYELKRSWMPIGIWLWGKTGTGKSRLARDLFKEAYYVNDNANWWDGYDAHEEVIVDDFRPAQISFVRLLKMVDRYPFKVETKGGHRELLAKGFIFTAPKHPLEYYGNRSDEDVDQLLRRFPIIVEIKK